MNGFPKQAKTTMYKKDNSVIPVISFRKGEKGTVAFLNTKKESMVRKLMAMGVIPGSEICLIQKFPSYVFRIDNTQLAVDKDIASTIYAKKS